MHLWERVHEPVDSDFIWQLPPPANRTRVLRTLGALARQKVFDTTREDPTIRVRIVHGDGTVRDDKTWMLSTLGGK